MLRPSETLEYQRCFGSARFRNYMIAWSVFFAVAVGVVLYASINDFMSSETNIARLEK